MMVLRGSFSNPLQRAFTHRRKNSDKDDVNAKMKSRNESIDQTVLTREDSQQMTAMADDMCPSSFEVEDFVDQPARARTDALIGDAPPNGDYDYHDYYHDRGTMAHSHSDPSFSAQYTAASHCSCTCIDCYAKVPQHQQRFSQSYPGSGGYVLSSSPQPSHPPPPPLGPPPNYFSYITPPNEKVTVDPALQARIEAIKIQEQLLGLAHPDVIFALAGIAKLYEKRGDHAQAANIMKEIQMRSIMAKSAPQGNLNRSSHEVEDVPVEISFPR